MNMTPEIRTALLTGTFGDTRAWPDVSMAPVHIQNRIVEIRYAIASQTAVPAPSLEYVRAAEKRSLAAGAFARKLFPTRTVAPVRKTNNLTATLTSAQLADLSRRSGVSVAILQTIEMRSKAKRLGAEIAKELREEVRNRRVTSKPTEQMTADEVRREFDRVMGWQ
jgi:hypothetical protein